MRAGVASATTIVAKPACQVLSTPESQISVVARGSGPANVGTAASGSRQRCNLLALCNTRTLYLRNVPDDVVERLERLAARENISVNAVAVRELAEASRRVQNPALLGDLPDLDVGGATVVDDVEVGACRAVIVIDASAAVMALLNDGPARRMIAADYLHAPHLVDCEVANVLRRRVRARQIHVDDGWRALDTWRRLAVSRYPVCGLLDRVWAPRNNLSAYDAAHVAPAQTLQSRSSPPMGG